MKPGFQTPLSQLDVCVVSAQNLSIIQLSLSENWRESPFEIDVVFQSQRIDNYCCGDSHQPAKVKAPVWPKAGQRDVALLSAL